MSIKKNTKKLVNAWAMYDWANSVYSLTITTAVFPLYYALLTEKRNEAGEIIESKVNFFGIEIINSALYSYAISFSFLLAAILSPILSSIADYSGRKLSFMKFFCYVGGMACMALFFFESKENWQLEFAIIMTVVASMGYSGSLVFYNAFLPEIVTEDRFDSVSAKGFSLGYIGSVILLVINLLMIMFIFPESFLGFKISFLMVGVWWIGFAQITFNRLPNNVYGKIPTGNRLLNGYRELMAVLKELRGLPSTIRYLTAFLFYNMGVQTVMYMATIFAEKEIDMAQDHLIITVLIIQLIAIPGAILFARLSKAKGNFVSISIILVIWIGITISSYFIYTEISFIILAACVGLVMGGIQSLSRSTYAKLIPPDTLDHASYFSFYDVMEKLSIVLGTFSYGLINQLFGSMRPSALSLTLFFVVGLILLFTIPKKDFYSVKSIN